MKKGFTLAEILITLAIIGVVAAITISTVIADYNKQQYYTRFMKMYSTLQTAIQLSVAQNGSPSVWTFQNYDLSQLPRTYIYPYLKIREICELDDSECVPYKIKNLPGNTENNGSKYFKGRGRTVFLQDGTTLSFVYGLNNPSLSLYSLGFYFDTNGPKGPNTSGRDVLYLQYDVDETNNKWQFANRTLSFAKTYCGGNISQSNEMFACGLRLILERKMNY